MLRTPAPSPQPPVRPSRRLGQLKLDMKSPNPPETSSTCKGSSAARARPGLWLALIAPVIWAGAGGGGGGAAWFRDPDAHPTRVAGGRKSNCWRRWKTNTHLPTLEASVRLRCRGAKSEEHVFYCRCGSDGQKRKWAFFSFLLSERMLAGFSRDCWNVSPVCRVCTESSSSPNNSARLAVISKHK